METEEIEEESLLDHYDYVRRMALPYKSTGQYEDLVQEGFIGLMKAWEKYDKTLDVQFRTYATYYIKCYMIKFLKKNVNKEIPINNENLMEYYITKAEGTPEELELGVAIKQVRDKCVDVIKKNNLSDRDLDILMSRYFDIEESSLRELSVQYNMSQEGIRQVEQRVIALLKEEIGEVDNG